MSKILYQQDRFPVLQNRVYETEFEARNCVVGNIALIEDQQTGLIYNDAFQPELMVYDESYNNEQSLSKCFQLHLKEVAELVENILGKGKLIEVGCGKGFFLEMLLERGVDIMGFDPTYNGNNPRVVKKYFDPDVIVNNAEGLILRHVLEHVPNPVDFLFQLQSANGGGGLVYIEVPCFEWICERRAWFDIFYEHVNYFRLNDFSRMFDSIVESGHFFGGQYIYIIADLASLREPVFDKNDTVSFPSDFLSSLHSQKNETTKYPVCVWGGASKGVIFSLLRKRAGLEVDVVIDINPAKQGKFLPVTGLEVQSPTEGLSGLPAGAPIFVMNSNYLNEISNMSDQKFLYIGVDQ
jgi:hypothetical protein